MEKRPFNFEDVDMYVEEIKNLVQIYHEVIVDNCLDMLPPGCVRDRIKLYQSILDAMMGELQDLSAGVKAAVEIEIGSVPK